MFENLCTLPLSSELFAQALHPTKPVLAVGLSSGHVQSFRLPPTNNSEDEEGNTSIISTGTSTIDTEWRTRRHKGSCRTITYSHDGEALYSAGTDGLLKVANSSTGQITSKILIQSPPTTSTIPSIDPPTVLHPLSSQTLLLATDSSALHVYDLRASLDITAKTSKPVQIHHPHDDYISSITPLPPTEQSTSGFPKQWVSTGGSTLAITDLRKGVLKRSEAQDDELLCSCFVSGLSHKAGRGNGEKVLVGGGGGYLTLWDKGVWDDQAERIGVDKTGGESLDCIINVPDGVGGVGKKVIVGVGDGTCRVVIMGVNAVVETLRHDDMEGVVGLGFDVSGRLISGGGSLVKVWEEGIADEQDGEEEGLENGEDHNNVGEVEKVESSEEEERPRKKRRRQKETKIKGTGNGIIGLTGLE